MLLLFQPKMALIWEWHMISEVGYFFKPKTEERGKNNIC